MERAWYALVPAGIALGLGAEWAAFDDGDLPLVLADLAVGWLLMGCGLVAWRRRPESRVGVLMTLSGATWFAGNLWQAALYLHRGPLVHLHLSYPTGRLSTRLAQAVVIAAYVDALIEPIASIDALTLALAALVALTSVQIFLRTSGPARKAAAPALAAALAFAAVLALGAATRLAGLDVTSAMLWTYDAVIATIAVTLLVDLLRGRWSEAAVTGLVVDLGGLADSGTLRGKLAQALGDRSLVLGYRLPETGVYVDEHGRSVDLPEGPSDRVATPIGPQGDPVAVLVHDRAVLADRSLLDAVAAAATIALANVRLQEGVRLRIEELEGSRRRIVEAGDAQRRALEKELRGGVERRLEGVASLLAEAEHEEGCPGAGLVGGLRAELQEARQELHEFAQGIRPAALAEGGLMAALPALAARSSLPAEVQGSVGRLPEPVEAAAYFVCAEGLTNAVKYAGAGAASIELALRGTDLIVAVTDNGVGGADPKGSGLRGLADRVEALGGRFTVESPPGRGTRLVAEIAGG